MNLFMFLVQWDNKKARISFIVQFRSQISCSVVSGFTARQSFVKFKSDDAANENDALPVCEPLIS